MSPVTIAILIVFYFSLLLTIAWFTGRNANNETFFLGNRKSKWYVVAFGMIGTSISGVTFISVPGWVGTSQFSYMQVVFGYLLGYWVILGVLMPAYYRLNLTSIYTYLESRFGYWAYKTGTVFFLFSRTFGSAARMYIVANVLYYTMFEKWGIPFVVTVFIMIMMIWLYTYRGGVKTVVWTDTLQTFFMLTAVVSSVYLIGKELQLGTGELIGNAVGKGYTKIFFFDNWTEKSFFFKHFFGGMFIAIAMTGLDQDMMQKNLSCRNIKDAQKNMFWFSLVLLPINLLFLSLGAILYLYAATKGIALPKDTDTLFPMIATGGYLLPVVGIVFITGIIAANYSSADSAITALTTSFTVDILGIKQKDEEKIRKARNWVHFGFSLLIIAVILVFRAINDKSVIDAIFTVAGYTYGPLLGLFAFGFLTKRKLSDSYLILIICLISPLICYAIAANSEKILCGYKFGYELLILNGFVTFLGLLLISKKSDKQLL